MKLGVSGDTGDGAPKALHDPISCFHVMRKTVESLPQ
jgi:hypothetical protein